MCAICALQPFGVPEGVVQSVIDSFKGVPHRIESVGEVRGVQYFNDSKSTTVMSLLTCLGAFADGKIILVMGGRDKGSDFTSLVPALNTSTKHVFIYGEAREKINQQLVHFARRSLSTSFEGALESAMALAQPGDRVVLSPACASQDLFRNFEHRGDVFRDWVNNKKREPKKH